MDPWRYAAQFDMFPMDSLSAVKALPSDLNNQSVPAADLTYLFRDTAGPVLMDGKRVAVAVTSAKDLYVFFGRTPLLETPDMIGILDPQLPEWLKTSIHNPCRRYWRVIPGTRAPGRCEAHHHGELGRADAGHVSRSGCALHALIIMTTKAAAFCRRARSSARRDCSS
jgi:hypothetical protein